MDDSKWYFNLHTEQMTVQRVLQMIFMMFHDLELDVFSLLRQQSELSEVDAAWSKLVFCVVAVFCCNTAIEPQSYALITDIQNAHINSPSFVHTTLCLKNVPIFCLLQLPFVYASYSSNFLTFTCQIVSILVRAK